MKKFLIALFTLLLLPAVVSAYAVKVDYWVIDGHGGIAYPVMDTANNLSLGYNLGVSVRRGLDTEISVGAGISYISMAYSITGTAVAPGPFTATVADVEAVYAPYTPDWIVWPYAKFGIAMYMMNYARETGSGSTATSEMHSETSFGFMGGVGARYPINNELAANAELLYHQASINGGTGDIYTFLTFNAGITVYMK